MKVETINAEFMPVRITLENQDEIDRLFAIFNFVPIKDALDLYEDNWALLFRELGERNTEQYKKYHNKLDALVARRR